MKEKMVAKKKVNDSFFYKALQLYKCNFFGMGFFDSIDVTKLLDKYNFRCFPRDEKKFYIKRFPIILGISVEFAVIQDILANYWSDETMETRILAFYEKPVIYSDIKLLTCQEPEFLYEAKEFVFSLSNTPENKEDEFLLTINESVSSQFLLEF